MANIGLDAPSDAVKRCIASFVRESKLGKHLAEGVDKCVDFLFGFKSHHLFLLPPLCAVFNFTAPVGEMQHKTGAT